MKKIAIPIIVGLVVAAVVLGLLVAGNTVSVLQPAGTIAQQQRTLIYVTVGLGMLVVLPVFIMLFTIAWKYRESNTKADYRPNWDHSRLYETIWWGVPFLIIFVLGVITWQSSHALDPFKPLASNVAPVKVQVVALQWRWLFIYPDQGVASVNLVQFPEKTPVDFQVTSDAPMNSFWIPQLGGQIYAMSGMSTQLHLMADSTGSYHGSSANISGEGFANMSFTAKSVSQADFDAWVKLAKAQSRPLDMDEYGQMSKPNKDRSLTSYSLKQKDLYDRIVMKYMAPEGGTESGEHSRDMTTHEEMTH